MFKYGPVAHQVGGVELEIERLGEANPGAEGVGAVGAGVAEPAGFRVQSDALFLPVDDEVERGSVLGVVLALDEPVGVPVRLGGDLDDEEGVFRQERGCAFGLGGGDDGDVRDVPVRRAGQVEVA